MRALLPVAPARLAALRAQVAAAGGAAQLAQVAEAHAGLLLGLLRQAGALGLPALRRPLDAAEACSLLGVQRSRRLLSDLLLLCPEQCVADPFASPVDLLRETTAALGERLDDQPAAEPRRAAQTLLRLLELAPRALARQEATARPAAWGEELLALCGGARWLHPRLAGGLRALAGQPAGEEDARAAALLRAAIEACASPRRGRDLAALLEGLAAPAATEAVPHA
jgi:hypothetical protein